MTNTYFSTFISGFSDVIKQCVKNFKIKLILDGLVIYETELNPEKVKNLQFFNNSFFLLDYIYGKDENNLDRLISESENFIHKKIIPSDVLIGKKSFRIIISKENELQHIAPAKLRQLEDLFSQKLRLKVDRANPDLEVWFLERSEGYSFCGIRLTKKPSTDKYLQKGELRPELSWILNFLSEPSKSDAFLDPFAGHGSIPIARTQFPFTRIIASDLHHELMKDNASIEVHKWDATELPLEDNSIDKIVTDPPWGHFNSRHSELPTVLVRNSKSIQISTLYEDLLKEFARVIKPNGIAIILTAQKEVIEKLLKEQNSFKLESNYNILVSGKKSGVYKLQKV